MKAVRRPLTDEVWLNVAFDEEGYEPMPEWVRAASESGATAGYTFNIHSEIHSPRVCKPGWWIVKGPTDVYPVSPEGFEASYETP